MKTLLTLLAAFFLLLLYGFLEVGGFIKIVLAAAIPWFLLLNMVPVLVWIERKGSAWMQDRTGPERAFIPGLGLRLAGMVHNLADFLKLATKEDFHPRQVNRAIYVLAPCLSIFVALVVGAVIPYCHPMRFADGATFTIQALDVNIGVLWVMAASSVGVYAVVLAGWGSNNKYSQLAGLRASAQMISYEVIFGLALAGLFLVYGSARLNNIVSAQSETFLWVLPKWGIVAQPVGFLLFFVAALAETNRTPFDLLEAESELVAGFHTEYGGFKFALFFMAEYVAIMVQCLLLATLFLGGWQLVPWLDTHSLLKDPGSASLVLKAILLVVFLGGLFIGTRLLKWHKANRTRWQDARAREGSLLSVLFGFGPAALALALFVFWGGSLSFDGAALAAGLIEAVILLTKALIFAWIFIWIRWTVPRFRYDQLMGLGWKMLLPLGMANLIVTAVLVQLGVYN